MASKRIGFIGLGRMGRPMAENVLRAGFPLTVWNRDGAKCAALAARGATKAERPADLAARCDAIVTMIAGTPDVEQVIFGAEGILEGAARAKRSGFTVIDMSTILPSASEAIARRLGAAGIDFLDAPVSGGVVGAEAGTLAIMAGGPREVFERNLDVLSAMGRKIVHMGPVGSGERMKLVNNLVCAVTMQALCEGLVMARRAGLDPASVLEVLNAGAAGCRNIDLYGEMLVSGRHEQARFSLALMHKDLGLALETAQALRTPLPATALAREVLNAARGLGLDEHNYSVIIRVMERVAGVTVGEQGPGEALT